MSERTKPWLETRLPMTAAWRVRLGGTMLPRDMPYLATIGALALGALVMLALSGLVLTVYYNAADGFGSIQFITREVNEGWLVQSFHETGATMLFGTVFLILFRELLGAGYRAPGEIVWFLKLFLFVLLLLTGYLGYTLADGATSYWSLADAATAGARLGGLPGALAAWFFGGAPGPGTLARMVVLHVTLALLLFGGVALHIIARRAVADIMPVSRSMVARSMVRLHPYYTSQYFVAFTVFALIFAILAFFAPHLGENPLNAVPATPLVLPTTLAPPWFLLPAAGLAGFLPGTAGAIIGVIAGFGVLAALPWLDRSSPGATPRGMYKLLTWLLALDVIGLSLTVALPGSTLAAGLGVIFIAWYFLHFLVLTPLVTGGTPK